MLPPGLIRRATQCVPVLGDGHGIDVPVETCFSMEGEWGERGRL